MFRKMRRFKQQLTEKETIQILKKGKTGILGVIGDEGYPYTVPINYVYENNKIYIHCAKTGHKIDAIKNNNKVSFCVIEKDDVVKEKLTTYYKSVIVFGKARILETNSEIFRAAQSLGFKYSDDKEHVQKEIKQELKALACVEIVIEHMTGKQSKDLAMQCLGVD